MPHDWDKGWDALGWGLVMAACYGSVKWAREFWAVLTTGGHK